jgi:hypothetical protein
VKQGGAPSGSRLAGRLNKVASAQIALRLPEPDVAKARELAARKGIGCQTVLKMRCMRGFAAKRARCERFATIDGPGVAACLIAWSIQGSGRILPSGAISQPFRNDG